MKSIFVLCLAAAAVASTSAWILNEKISSMSATIPKQKTRRLVLYPKPSRRNNIRRLIFLKHLLELKCLREICNQVYCQNGDVSGCHGVSESTRPQLYQNQPYYYNRVREEQNRRRYPDHRVAYAPPNVYFNVYPRTNPYLRRPAPPSFHVIKEKYPRPGDLTNQNTENIMHVQSSPQAGESRKAEERIMGEELNDVGIGDVQTGGDDKVPQPAVRGSETTFYPYWLTPTTNRTGQYEVKEIVDEKPIVEEDELDGKKPAVEKEKYSYRKEPKVEKDNGTDVNKPAVEKDSNSDRKKPQKEPSENSKAKADMKTPDNSIKEVQETTKQKARIDSPILSTIKSFLNHRFRDFADEKPSQVRKDQAKHLIIPPPDRNFHIRGPKIVPEIPPEQNVNYVSPTAGKPVKTTSKSPILTLHETFLDDLDFPSSSEQGSTIGEKTLKPLKYPDLNAETKEQKTTETTKQLLTEPLDFLYDLDFLSHPEQNIPAEQKVLEQKVDDLSSISAVENTLSTLQELRKTEKPSTAPITFPKIQTTITSQEFHTTKTGHPEFTDNWTFPKESDTPTATVNVETVEYYSEATVNKADFTTPDFQEFSDHPLLFDLFSKAQSDLKQETEAAWKNSRKMNFGEHDEKRRSDILITENADYFDYENNFSASDYLEKLKQNSSLLTGELEGNLTSEPIIQLIPTVVSDLREGKISPEALPILSETFGKFWPTILVLSNSTNLDMLSLMKIKSEEDLENVLRSFLPESTTVATAGNTEADLTRGFYYDLYEYMDNYKDLYKDFGIVTDKRKRFVDGGSIVDLVEEQMNL